MLLIMWKKINKKIERFSDSLFLQCSKATAATHSPALALLCCGWPNFTGFHPQSALASSTRRAFDSRRVQLIKKIPIKILSPLVSCFFTLLHSSEARPVRGSFFSLSTVSLRVAKRCKDDMREWGGKVLSGEKSIKHSAPEWDVPRRACTSLYFYWKTR